MIFTIWITRVGRKARPTICPRLARPKAGETMNRLLRPGVKSTSISSTTPAKKAPMEALLVENFSLKIDASPRQLKPWNRRARVRVEKAMVEASTASPPW